MSHERPTLFHIAALIHYSLEAEETKFLLDLLKDRSTTEELADQLSALLDEDSD